MLCLLFALGVVSVLFMQLPGDTLLWRELQNTAHTIVFAIMTLAFMGILRGVFSFALNKAIISYVFAATVLVIVAVLTELGQLLTQREPSLSDIVRDLGGVLIGLGLYTAIDPCFMALWKRQSYVLQIGAIILSSCLLVASLLPVLNLAYAYVQRNQAFPVIIDFQAGWAQPFLGFNQAVIQRIDAPDILASVNVDQHHQQVSELTLDRGSYPGISIIEPYPDWSGYKTLTLDIYSPQVLAYSLVLRINDSQHDQAYSDRFNQALTVNQGMNRFRIPLLNVQHAPAEREMDMRHISNATLFMMNIDGPVKFYPGTLGLE